MKRLFWIVPIVVLVVLAFIPRGDKMPGLSPLAVEFAYGSTDAVNFGHLPKISDMPERTYSAWVWRDSLDVPNVTAMVFAQLTDFAGVGIYTGTNAATVYIQIKCTTQQGVWHTPGGVILADSAWHHILVTVTDADTSSVAPLAYIDGSNEVLTEVTPHSGAPQPEDGVPLVIGNELTATYPLNLPFNGKIFDPRIYNRVLTAGEITTLYNSGTPSMSAGTKSGLVFQGFAVRTEKLADYVGEPLTGLKLFDAQFLAVGSVNSAPVGRAAP